MPDDQTVPVPWPNQMEPVDGVVSVSDVSQDAGFAADESLDPNVTVES